MRSFRNINIMSYCNGTIRVADIINTIKTSMSEIGYSDEEIKKSISQIALISLATEVDLDSIGCTVVDFHDLNDTEVMDCESNISKEIEKHTNESQLGEQLTIIPGTNRAEYTIGGSGEHSVSQFENEATAMPACVRKVISNMLENSLQNANGNFTPITVKTLTEGCQEIIDQAQNGKNREQLINQVDASTSYQGARRLTMRESNLYDELAESYDSQIKIENELNISRNEASTQRRKNEQMLSEAEKSCTHSNYLRILGASGWQLSKKQQEEMSGEPTDQELINSQQTTIRNQEETISSQEARLKNLRTMLDRALQFANTVRSSVFGKVFFGRAAKQLPKGEEIDK